MLKDYKINRGYIRESPFKEIDNRFICQKAYSILDKINVNHYSEWKLTYIYTV
jgi:hypothetical protein